ncbi:ribonuclease HI [Ancylostoma caninum]|uniref:Ribonuclease H n=1 Tax=Ancylostoma caninum TaxID=29170 RepID=A0A368H215_ANCCA|nr:ribonuclease HI [Ancylostoma caninum]
MCMQEQLATMRMAGSLQKSTQVLQAMQNLVKVPEIMKTMREMSQEMMKLGIIDEMIEETMDSMEPADLEEAAQLFFMRFRLVHVHLERFNSYTPVDSSMAKFYAVAHGFERGIYENWDDAKKQIDDFPQAVYKKFSTREEAEEYFNARQPKKIESAFPEPNLEKYYAVARGYAVGVFTNYEDVKKHIEDYPQPLHKKFDKLDDAIAYFNKFFHGNQAKESEQEKEKPSEEATKKKSSKEDKQDKPTTYYAVARGHTTGVFTSWDECKKQTTGFKGAKFKKFDNEEEAKMFAEGKTLKQIEEAMADRKRPAETSSSADDAESAKKPKKLRYDTKLLYGALLSSMAKGGFYAVANGRNVGVYTTWDQCRAEVNGFPQARYKKFGTEREAQEFIANYQLGCRAAVSSRPPTGGSDLAQSSIVSRKRKAAVAVSGADYVAPKRLKDCDQAIWKDAPIVYTDGACSGNGRKAAKVLICFSYVSVSPFFMGEEINFNLTQYICVAQSGRVAKSVYSVSYAVLVDNARAGYGVYWGSGHTDNTCGPVHGPATNNRGELEAVDVALKQAISKQMECIIVRTDSQLLMKSMDSYMDTWKRNSWKTSTGEDVKNQDLLRSIDESSRKIHVKFEYVPGHSGDAGNDAADELARRGAQMYRYMEAASTRTISPEESKVFQHERPWAVAPVVIAHGRTAQSNAKADGLIRWLHHPKRLGISLNIEEIVWEMGIIPFRDVLVEFDSQDNLYTVQVKAVFYAILSAMLHRVSHVIIYSTNEIVVKVGNGTFKPKKEVKFFQSIRRRTSTNENDCDTRVRLHLLDNDALVSLKLTQESATCRNNVPVCSEDLFRERHSSEIVRI